MKALATVGMPLLPMLTSALTERSLKATVTWDSCTPALQHTVNTTVSKRVDCTHTVDDYHSCAATALPGCHTRMSESGLQDQRSF